MDSIHESNSYPLPDEIPLSDHEDGGSGNDDDCTAVPISGLRTVQSEDVKSYFCIVCEKNEFAKLCV